MNAPAGGPPELDIEGPADQWLAPPPPPPHPDFLDAETSRLTAGSRRPGGSRRNFSDGDFFDDDDEDNPKEKSPDVIRLERLSNKDIGALMGKAWRNPITGQVHLKDFGIFPDFSVVDLFTRDYLFGTADQLSQNPYLFRPVPLPLRTWIYHYIFRMGRVLSVGGADEDGGAHHEDAMIRHVLGLPVIDLPDRAGCWSPLMCYVPLVLVVCLTCDTALVVVGICVVVFTLFINWFLNTPDFYRFTRPVSIPLRIGFFVWLIIRMQDEKETETGVVLAVIGFICGIIGCLGEFGLGDCGAICGYRLHCQYEVLRSLPNRIFICRRIGAAGTEERDWDVPPVNECVTGMGSWSFDMALIADVKGLIVELKPMSRADWSEVYEERHWRTHRFIGIDVYNPGNPTVDTLDAHFQEQQLQIARNKMQQALSSEADGAGPILLEDA